MLFKRHTPSNSYTLGFYNLENIFDTEDDPLTLDDDFTPQGPKKWTEKRYRRKLHKLARTIEKLGKITSGKLPSIIGVAEVENKKVLKDLINTKPLNRYSLGIAHHDSPDERGIDTALLYDSSCFELIHSEAIPLLVHNEEGVRDFTRDILYVRGKLNGEALHVFVNHWPSRRKGEEITESRRLTASHTLSSFIKDLLNKEVNASLVIMGDFNDGPEAKSIKQLKENLDLYNPMEKLATPERGSANYRRTWSLFDQILISHSFFNYEKGTHSFTQANIFDAHFLTEWKGRYRGNPFRTYVGKKYLGGFSDHFPVYIQLKFNN
ncbi:endonuclease [Lentiprolixibacter aurantiacus]|uniref:Endonuclease n=1 Tax=Lentiprolixibacter aurantiacus TaxID=2993939 RepID=A0AAE3MJC6_9FLAO|nr:endonuclease [Lentiprolixibacter aurantiacus]MCX2718638.1 endonuclease [Lentiprolixibacter aurantiacus]